MGYRIGGATFSFRQFSAIHAATEQRSLMSILHDRIRKAGRTLRGLGRVRACGAWAYLPAGDADLRPGSLQGGFGAGRDGWVVRAGARRGAR